MKTLKSESFYILALALSAILWGIVFFVDFEGDGVSTPVKENSKETLRCGINSLYLALRYLGEEGGAENYGKLARTFPLIETEGMSLEQIQDYLRACGFFCSFTKINEGTIKCIDTENLAFVLRREGRREHIFLLRRDKQKNLQAVDSTKGTWKFSDAEIKTLGGHAVFVGKNKMTLPPEETLIEKHLLAILFIMNCAILGVLLFCRYRRSRGESVNKNQKKEIC
jgi:hypothetical protein